MTKPHERCDGKLCSHKNNSYLEFLEIDGRHDERLPGVRGGLADPDPRLLLRVLPLFGFGGGGVAGRIGRIGRIGRCLCIQSSRQ